MPLVVSCPSGHRLKVPKKYVGRRILCPVCDARIDIPGEKTPAVPAAEKPPLPKPVPKASPPPPMPVATAAEQQPATSEAQTPLPSSVPTAIQTPAPTSTDQVAASEMPKLSASPELSASPASPELSASLQMDESGALAAAREDVLPFATTPFEDAPQIQIDTSHISEWDVPSEVHKAIDPIRAQAYNVILMAIASMLVAGFCLAPSIMEQRLAREFGLRSPDVWSYIVILVALVQIAFSIYAIRVPDWSTAWLMTVAATFVAAMYAAGLAITMFADNDHALVRQLGLLDEAMRYRAQPWCFFVLCITLILAFCCGRFSVFWHQSELQLANSRQH